METKEIFQKIKQNKADIHDLLKFIQRRELAAFDRGYFLRDKIMEKSVNIDH